MWDKTISFLYALIIHLIILALLFWSVGFRVPKTSSSESSIQAVAISEDQVVAEIGRLKAARGKEKIEQEEFERQKLAMKEAIEKEETRLSKLREQAAEKVDLTLNIAEYEKQLRELQQRQLAEKQALKEIEKERSELEMERLKEEKRLMELALEAKRREEEREEEMKRQTEEKRKQDEAKEKERFRKDREKAEAEAEKKRQESIEAEKQKLEEQRQQLAAKEKELKKQREKLASEAREKAKAEAAKQAEIAARKKVEAKRQAEIAAQKSAESAAESAEAAAREREIQQDRIAIVSGQIMQKVQDRFEPVFGVPKDISCLVNVSVMPDGSVYNVTIETSSGNAMFDRDAISAVYKASPLPIPSDVFDHFRDGIPLRLKPPQE